MFSGFEPVLLSQLLPAKYYICTASFILLRRVKKQCMEYTPYGALLYPLSYPARAGAGLEPATRSNTHLRHLLISFNCVRSDRQNETGDRC